MDQPIRGHRSRSHRRKSQDLQLPLQHTHGKCDTRMQMLKNAAKHRSKSASSPFKSRKQLVSPTLSLVECDLAAYSSEQDNARTLQKPARTPSIPSLIKLHILSLFGSPIKKQLKEKDADRKAREEKLKAEYRELFEQILKEDIANYARHKPVLEHSMSAPESEVFAVREFPASSRPRLEKHSSLDTKLQSDHKVHISSHNGHMLPPVGPISSQVLPEHDHNDPMLNGHNVHSGALDSDNSVSNGTAPPVGCENSVYSSPESDYGLSDSFNDQFADSCQMTAKCSASDIRPNDSCQGEGNNVGTRFTIGGSDSETEGWVHATTKAIKSVESRVERLTSSQRYYMYNNGYSTKYNIIPNNGERSFSDNSDMNSKQNGKVDQDKSTNGKANSRNGSSSIDHPRVKLLSQSRLSQSSSVSSFSSDTGTFSDSDTDDFGSLFDTDTDGKKDSREEEEDDDDVFDNGKEAGDNFANMTVGGKTVNNEPNEVVKEKEPDGRDDNEQGPEEGNESFKRFYHVFKEGELSDLITRHVECLHVIDSYYDHANWCVVAEKVRVWTI